MSTANDAHPSVAPKATARLAALAVRRGVALGVLQSAAPGDFALVLAAAAKALPAGRGYAEREVNERLLDFLAGAGAMLATDHVELRRWLVDFRLLDRDGFGRVYTVGTPAAEFAAAARAIDGVDLAAVARAARERDAAVRAERKARWQAAQGASRG
jgi:hypothetical protein